jgi:hypothetical protein
MHDLHDMITRIIVNMEGRVTGPMKFRLVLQPLMATFFAVRDGLKDAKTGKPPYFWSLLYRPKQREQIIEDGWRSIGKVFILALILDVIYQIIEIRFVYLGEALIVALVLALVPYLLLRGIVRRVATRVSRRKTPAAPPAA